MRDNINNISINFVYFIIFNLMFYYLLTLNIILYERNKNVSNLIFIDIMYITHITSKWVWSLYNIWNNFKVQYF